MAFEDFMRGSSAASGGGRFEDFKREIEAPTAQSFWDLITPSMAPKEPEEFSTSMTYTPRTWAAERSARTELARHEYEFRAQGKGEEWEEFVDQHGKTGFPRAWEAVSRHFLTPTFELISMGNVATAGMVQEILRTGSAWEGFKQAGREIAEAMPGVEWEGARKPTFNDVFQEQGMSKWGAWTAGLACDILLDPTNLIPIGAAAKPLRFGGRMFLKHGGPIKDAFHFLFTPHRELVPLGETGKDVLGFLNKAEAQAANESYALMDKVKTLTAWMQPHERWMFGLWMDQPERLATELGRLAQVGIVQADRIPQLMKQAEEIRVFNKEMIFDPEVEKGLLDQLMFREYYVHGTTPIDPKLQRAYDQAVRERAPFGMTTTLPIGKTMPASMARTTENQADRFMRSLMGQIPYGTELDIGNILSARSVMHARWVATRDLIENSMSSLEKSQMAARIAAEDFASPLEWIGRKTELETLRPGYKVLEITQKARTTPTAAAINAAAEEGRDAVGKSYDKVVAAWMVPEPVHQVLTKADRIFRNQGDMGKFWDTADRITNVWRGWATFSPGYHTRNVYSNLFLEWLAGVGTDYGSYMKGKFPTPGGFMLRHLQAFKVQLAADGAGRMPKWALNTANGMAKKLGYDRLSDVPLVKGMSAQDLAKLGEVEGVPHTSMALWGAPEKVEKEMWESIEPHVDLVELTKGGVAEETQRALELGATVKGSWGDKLRTVFGGQNPALKFHRSFGAMLENHSRWALFLDRLDKGATSLEAARATKTWLFDYRTLTEIEKRVFRSILPFYAWSRFALPRMLMATVENPARMSRVPKVLRAIENTPWTPESWKDDQLPTPDYFDETLTTQLPAMENDRPLYLSPDLPVLEINRMNLRAVSSGLHPFLKGVVETFPEGGYNLFLGRTIEKFSGEESTTLPGVSKMGQEWAESMFPPLGKYVTRPLQAYQRGELAPQLVSELIGLRFRSLDVRRVLRAQTFLKRTLAVKFKQKLEQERRDESE